MDDVVSFASRKADDVLDVYPEETKEAFFAYLGTLDDYKDFEDLDLEDYIVDALSEDPLWYLQDGIEWIKWYGRRFDDQIVKDIPFFCLINGLEIDENKMIKSALGDFNTSEIEDNLYDMENKIKEIGYSGVNYYIGLDNTIEEKFGKGISDCRIDEFLSGVEEILGDLDKEKGSMLADVPFMKKYPEALI